MRTYTQAILDKLRIKEILLMTGFSFIGLIFSNYSLEDINLLFSLSVFIFLFVLNIYFLNFYADYSEDLYSKRLNNEIVFSRSYYLIRFIITSLILVGLSLLINYIITLLYISIVFFWTMYYLPPLRLKSKTLLGTLVHFVAGILHFHIGYSAFDDASSYSIMVSIYFALLLSIGHLNHEALDYDNDYNTGIKTTAVRLGLHHVYQLKLALIYFTLVYWLLLYLFGITDEYPFYIFITPLVITLAFLKTSRYTAQTFQKVSRAVFLLAGIIYFIATTIL